MLEKLLLVDDDEITVTICKMVLTKVQIAKEVDVAKHGQEGIEYFKNLQYEIRESNPAIIPELILLDLNMPVMDGWDFLKHYMEDYAASFPNVKVAILSSTINPEDFKKARQYNIVIDFISKPLTVDNALVLKKHEKLQAFFQ